jgi:uncharacterized RDD family membrane protein YckC
MSSGPPAGWYAAEGDPPGTVRYWDGSRWVGDPVQSPARRPDARTGPGGAPGIDLAGETRPLAGFWVRVGAALIDVVIIWIGVAFGAAGLVQGSAASAVPFVSLAPFLYWWWGDSTGQTLGKRALGLQVVTPSGEIPGGATGLGRSLGRILSSFFFGLGYLWVAFDARKQAWHDKLAGTYVVRIPR